MRLVLDDETAGSSAHHMTAEWQGSGRLVFEDAALGIRVALDTVLRWAGRDDYGTITQEGDSAALYPSTEQLVIRIEQQRWLHEDVTVLSAQHFVSDDGGRTWRADAAFDVTRLAGARPTSKVGV